MYRNVTMCVWRFRFAVLDLYIAIHALSINYYYVQHINRIECQVVKSFFFTVHTLIGIWKKKVEKKKKLHRNRNETHISFCHLFLHCFTFLDSLLAVFAPSLSNMPTFQHKIHCIVYRNRNNFISTANAVSIVLLYCYLLFITCIFIACPCSVDF